MGLLEKYYHAIADPALTVGGGLLGQTVGGLMALPVAALKGNEEANLMLQAVQDRTRYTPTNETGQAVTEDLMGLLSQVGQPIQNFANYSSERLQDVADIHGGLGGAGYIAGQMTPEILGTAMGINPSLKRARQMNARSPALYSTKPPITPFSKQQGLLK